MDIQELIDAGDDPTTKLVLALHAEGWKVMRRATWQFGKTGAMPKGREGETALPIRSNELMDRNGWYEARAECWISPDSLLVFVTLTAGVARHVETFRVLNPLEFNAWHWHALATRITKFADAHENGTSVKAIPEGAIQFRVPGESE